jgi:transcriptional regulator with XRE-family HTH domain
MLLRVRRTRLERGLRLAEAASRVGVASQTLARVETGREVPWRSLRERLAELYGVPVDSLFEDIDFAQAVLRARAGELQHEPEAA